MPALAMLEAEFDDLVIRFGLVHDADEPAVMSHRFQAVIETINRTPPEDLTDCRIKIARLADPVQGMKEPGDMLALRQVADFLGQVAG
jgi:hypothetical protein